MLRDGQAMHVLSAAYNPAQPHLQRQIHHVSATLASDGPNSAQELQFKSIPSVLFGLNIHRQLLTCLPLCMLLSKLQLLLQLLLL